MSLAYKLPDSILVYLRGGVDPEFVMSSMEFPISQRNGPIATKRKASVSFKL